MELIVFDLDGTLLNRQSEISAYTSETLKLLSRHDIAYTVATGRTLHGARAILQGHSFDLPQAYKNGVMIWHPQQQLYSSSKTLTADDVIYTMMRHMGAGWRRRGAASSAKQRRAASALT